MKEYRDNICCLLSSSFLFPQPFLLVCSICLVAHPVSRKSFLYISLKITLCPQICNTKIESIQIHFTCDWLDAMYDSTLLARHTL